MVVLEDNITSLALGIHIIFHSPSFPATMYANIVKSGFKEDQLHVLCSHKAKFRNAVDSSATVLIKVGLNG